MHWFVLGAAAQAPAPVAVDPDAAIHAAVDAQYGRDIPEAAVCIVRPEAKAPVHEGIAAVGVKRGSRGCVLLGVMVDEAFVLPDGAYVAGLDGEAFGALDASGQHAALLRFTEQVLLAFDQPTGQPGKVSARKGGGFVIERRILRRDEDPGSSLDLTMRTSLDANRSIVDETSDTHERYQTALYVRKDRLEGVPEGAVDAALKAHGRIVSTCYADAWEADLTLEGRVRLEWTVAGGKVSTVAVVTEANTNEALAACYARAVRAGTYPPEAAGSVTWIFAVQRGERK